MNLCKIFLITFIVQCQLYCHGVHGRTNFVDETLLSSMDKFFTGSPPLLHSLAGKEQVIYLIIDHFQQQLLNELRNTTLDEASKNEILPDLMLAKSYMKDFDETSGKLGTDHNRVAWNPVAAYHMIRRFAVDLKAFLRGLNIDKAESLRTQNHILSVMKDFGWPTEEDLRSAMNGILRVQHVYNLNTKEFSEGKIHGTDTNVGLTASDCHQIGRLGMEKQFYSLAVEWMEAASEKGINETSVMNSIIQNDLRHAMRTHDEAWERSAGWEHFYFMQKLSEVPQTKRRIKRRDIQFKNFKGGKTFNLNEINFWGLCDGENYQPPEERKKLFCWHETKINNIWTINPIKAELLSFNPLIVQYHQVLGDTMIDQIKRQASPQLARSTVIDEESRGRKVTAQRTSLSAWIQDMYQKNFIQVPTTIQHMTGLKVAHHTAAEELQIASYAFGGHYEVHMDALRINPETRDRGDRIATFMVYLSDVEKGGSTAFPIAGVAARPIKGSAVFWHNLFSDGSPDERTWHGACPVILGEKWVANKWIRFYDQFITHKCGLLPQKSIEFKVNGEVLRL